MLVLYRLPTVLFCVFLNLLTFGFEIFRFIRVFVRKKVTYYELSQLESNKLN